MLGACIEAESGVARLAVVGLRAVCLLCACAMRARALPWRLINTIARVAWRAQGTHVVVRVLSYDVFAGGVARGCGISVAHAVVRAHLARVVHNVLVAIALYRNRAVARVAGRAGFAHVVDNAVGGGARLH